MHTFLRSGRKEKELHEVAEDHALALRADLAKAAVILCSHDSLSFPATSSFRCSLSERCISSLHIAPFLPPLGCVEMF